MIRRAFVAGLMAVAVRPLAVIPFGRAWAQSGIRPKMIAVIFSNTRDQDSEARLTVFRNKLSQLGGVDNFRIESRFGEADTVITKRQAQELLDMRPDVFLVNGSRALAAVLELVRGYQSSSQESVTLSRAAS